jgi:hypothetical protein
MTIEIFKRNNQLLLRYEPERSGVEWIDERLQSHGNVTIRKVFTFGKEELITEPELNDNYDERIFLLGVLDNDFYQINRNILGLKNDLYLSTDLKIDVKTFISVKNISIFRKIDRLIDEQIVIGGDVQNSIPINAFEELLKNFPTSTELTHYSNARISRVLREYLGTMSNAQIALSNYLKRRQTLKLKSQVSVLYEYEIQKYEFIRDSLHEMLSDPDSYVEADWQKKIIVFLLLIFPKYVAVLPNLHVKDFYSKSASSTNRYIDLTLVDANGHIDIIEIKRPFEKCILSRTKYRDNYVPMKELSGSIMQVEKYIFHLNKWGVAGEKQINNKRKHELPNDMVIRVTNPKALIILGRDRDFADDQKFDFEIIKRKFANIIDIMTYDDLLRRLDNIIVKFSSYKS